MGFFRWLRIFFRSYLLPWSMAILYGGIAAVAGVFATNLFGSRNTLVAHPIIASTGVIALLAVLYVAADSRHKRNLRRWGTAYYLGLLEASMRDRHSASFQKLINETKYQDYRALSSKLSTPERAGYSWVSEVEQMVVQMQESLNEDDVSTGYSLAPNMLFPAALSFGSQIFFADEIELLEMPTDERNKNVVSTLQWPRWGIGNMKIDIEKMFRSKISSFRSGNIRALNAGFSRYQFDLDVKKFESTNGTLEDGVILVTLQNSTVGSGPLRAPHELRTQYHFSLLPKQKCDTAQIVRKRFLNRKLYDVRAVPNAVGTYEVVYDVYGRDLLEACMRIMVTIETARHNDGGSPPIVLMARLPKSTALALGQALDLVELPPNATSIWKDLIVLNWEPGPRGGAWRIAQVHPAQPSLVEQCLTLESYGYQVPELRK